MQFYRARLGRLALKEFRETLRDRRTIGTLILMPILVYPLLSLTFQRLVLPGLGGPQDEPAILVVFEREEDAELLRMRLQAAHMLETPAGRRDWPQLEMRLVEDVDRSVAEGTASLGVRVTYPESLRPGGQFELLYRPEALGWQAVLEIESRLHAVNEESLRRELEQRGVETLLPAPVVRRPIEPRGGESPLTTLIPLILILMTITGAVYPAIDLTAGERERGTLETLIASPAPRLALLLAKYAAVVSVAVLTATVNLAAMSVTIYISGLGPLLFGESGLSLLAVAQVLGLLILFAAFFAAILLAITSVARSFKEAQAYLIPLMLLSIAPGLLSLMPGIELTPGLATVPLVNMVLLARDTFQGEAQLSVAVTALVTTVLYSFAAIGLAARVFGGDAILYGSSRSWSDLLRPHPGATSVSAGTAALAAALLLPGQFLLGGITSRLAGSMTVRLALSGAATVLLFAGLPWALTALQRANQRAALRLNPPSPWAWPAALLLGVSLWPLAHEVYQLGLWLGLASISEQQLSMARDLLKAWQQVPLWLLVLVIGVAPGICEELFFRGLVFAGWRRQLRPWATVLATAVLFGLFHLVTPTVAATERLLPSTFLGLVLGWVALRSGSVLPGMLVHVTHNSLLVLLSQRLNPSEAWLPGQLGTLHLPPLWVLAGLAGTLVGLAIIGASGAGGARGAGEPGSRGAGEQGSRGAGEPRSRGAGERGSCGAGE